jgi:polar amino acid transport system permease protein
MPEALQTVWERFPDWIPEFVPGAVMTMWLTAVGFGIAFALGIAITLLRQSHSRVIGWFVRGYVGALRGVPLLAVLYLLYFALPGAGIRLSAFQAAVIGLGLVHSTYLAEVFRAGLQAIHRGQRESALAVGLRPAQAFRLIVFPQAIRIVLPPLLINLIMLLKDSSVCALIAVNEITLAARSLMSETYLPLPVFFLAACFYFSIAWPASLLVKQLERRTVWRRAAGSKPA